MTLSTIFAPINTGLTLSLALEYPRLTAGTELPLVYIGALPLDGEHDCLLALPPARPPGSTELERGLGAPGLPLVAESGLSGNVVLRFGGVSSEKPGMSDGFHGLDLTVGEAPRDTTEAVLDGVGIGFAAGEEGFAGFDVVVAALAEMTGRRVGVADLDMVLGGGSVGLEVGVEDLAVDLDSGVVDLEGPADLVAVLVVEDLVVEPAGLVIVLDAVGVSLDELVDLLIGGVGLVVADAVDLELVRGGRVDEETEVVREVGVEGLEDFELVVSVDDDLPVGVAGLDPGPPDDEGLRVVPLEELNPVGCLDVRWFLAAGSDEEFASYDI